MKRLVSFIFAFILMASIATPVHASSVEQYIYDGYFNNITSGYTPQSEVVKANYKRVNNIIMEADGVTPYNWQIPDALYSFSDSVLLDIQQQINIKANFMLTWYMMHVRDNDVGLYSINLRSSSGYCERLALNTGNFLSMEIHYAIKFNDGIELKLVMSLIPKIVGNNLDWDANPPRYFITPIDNRTPSWYYRLEDGRFIEPITMNGNLFDIAQNKWVTEEEYLDIKDVDDWNSDGKIPKSYDKNKDGRIDRHEYATWVNEVRPYSDSGLKDFNGDGVVNMYDYWYIMNNSCLLAYCAYFAPDYLPTLAKEVIK